jgi:uncharacterized protein YutE (UPF0331/DUF86 family)
METPVLKIDALRRCLKRVREVAARDASMSNTDFLDIIVLNLQRACEQAIDLANWTCAQEDLDLPRASAEAFEILERAEILDPTTALSMRKMVGFRNIAVHEYRKLDPAIVRSIVTNKLGDFELFIAQMGKRLQIAVPVSLFAETEGAKEVVSLVLEKASVVGDDLGDDFEIQVEANKHSGRIALDISTDKSLTRPLPILHTILRPGTATLPVRVNVEEYDLVASDSGQGEIEAKLSGEGWRDQLLVTELLIKGRGRTESRKQAKFTVAIGLKVSRGSLFVDDVSPDGWIKTIPSGGGDPISLPHGLAVEFLEQEKGRERFRVVEGVHANKVFSCRAETGSHLVTEMPRFPPRHIKVDQKALLLIIPDLGKFEIKAPKKSHQLIPKGLYKLGIPDAPHDGGLEYVPQAPHAKSWFLIGDDGDRYLHPGLATKGCVTVADVSLWESIYDHLICARTGDGRSVGTIEII